MHFLIPAGMFDIKGETFLPSRRFGIDAGSMNIKICQSGRGMLANERDMIAIQKKKETIAIGNAAYDMFERTSGAIVVSSPVREGIIADISNLQKIVEALLRKNGCTPGFIHNNHFYLSVPSDVTEVEKRAYFSLISHSSYSTRSIFLVEKPIASAIGEKLPVMEDTAVMLVDMGAGSTEITVMTAGGIVVSRLLRQGGNTVNNLIVRLARERCHLIIGQKTAEYLKLELGSAIPDSKRTLKVYGRDLISGLPSEAEVPVDIVFDALKPYLIEVFKTVLNMISTIPPELALKIVDKGICFTGGSCMIPGLKQLAESVLHVRTIFSEAPLESAARGLAAIMQSPGSYRDVIFSMRDSAFE